MSNNNDNTKSNNIKTDNTNDIQEKPPLPKHDLTSRVSEIFELINTEKDKTN
mgnify:FL=1